MSTHKLRHPNFHCAKPPSSNNADDAGASAATGSVPRDRGHGPATARGRPLPTTGQLAKYTRRCHTRLVLAAADHDAAFHADEEEAAQFRCDGRDPNATATATDAHKKKEEQISMEQCVILLAPMLKIFQASCTQNSRARAKKSKHKGKQTRPDAPINPEEHGADDDDEVPPQILRLARFFHFRWLPMKRALLRRPPPPPPEDGARAPDAELGFRYRLRLARACWKKGLVAAAECEALTGPPEAGARRAREAGRDGTAEGSAAAARKRGRTDDAAAGGDRALRERVRRSLMRLPTEALRPERSVAAWRHAKDMIVECCERWEERGAVRPGATSREEDTAAEAPAPAQVAEWALTCWTALSLSQGMDCATVVPAHHPPGANHVTAIEKQLATLLSDRSTSKHPTLAVAVTARIHDLLSPRTLRDLNGLHLYSLGKLFASFHSREEAEGHITTSIVACASAGRMLGLEQMARLLAVYACCIAAAAIPADAANAAHTSVGQSMAPRRRTVQDLEERLYRGISKTITSEKGNGARKKKASHHQGEMSSKATSFLEAVIAATSHLVQCCKE